MKSVVVLGSCAALAWPGVAAGAVYNVTTTSDGGPGSLRAAVLASNAGGGANTINLPAGRYKFTLTASDSPLGAGGDLDVAAGDNLTINGADPASTIIDAAETDRAFAVANGASLALSGVTITNGAPATSGSVPPQNGGGIYNVGTLTVTNSVLDSNAASGPGGGYGGGLYTDTGSATINRSTFVRNYGQSQGGAIVINGGALNISASTLDGNATFNNGGGIYFIGGTTTITNSTIVRNHAGGGGGLYFSTAVTAHIVNDTIAFNTGGYFSAGGGVFSPNGAGFGGFVNTIVAANGGSSSGRDCSSSTVTADGGNNLDGDGSCFTGSSDVHGDPLLGLPALNGGSTLTAALLPGSPAIDAGSDVACPAGDQRGVLRPFGPHCDIGAVEYAPPANTAPPVISGSAAVAAQLVCSPGLWSGAPAIGYVYQWKRNGSPMAGATGSSYVVQGADLGQPLTCTVVEQTSDGAAAATSAAVVVAGGGGGGVGGGPGPGALPAGSLNAGNPMVSLLVSRGAVRLAHDSRTIAIPLRNDNPFPIVGTAHVWLPAFGVLIASKTKRPSSESTAVTVPAGTTKTLYLNFSHYALRLLRHYRQLKMEITLAIAGPVGAPVSVTGHYVLRAPRRS